MLGFTGEEDTDCKGKNGALWQAGGALRGAYEPGAFREPGANICE